MEILPFVLIVLFYLLEAFFSGSEIAIVAASRIKLRQKAEMGHHGSRLVERMMERPENVLSTTLVGTNLAVVANTMIVTMMLKGVFPQRGELYTLLIMAPVLWLFGEIIPKSVFQQKANIIAPRVIYGLWFASRIFYPVVWILTRISKILLRLLGADAETGGPFVTRQEPEKKPDRKRRNPIRRHC
ncbi:CNNM domain-containing protein [Thermodesulfobacteriota bacterium]